MEPRRRLSLSDLGLVAFSVTMTVGAQLALRHGMAALSGSAGAVLTAAALSPWVLLGLGMYGLSTLTWLTLLTRVDLVVAYPLGSLNFVFITLFAWLVLGESVGPLRWAGTVLILVGIWVLARGEGLGSAS